jgi:hypothetical protein
MQFILFSTAALSLTCASVVKKEYPTHKKAAQVNKYVDTAIDETWKVAMGQVSHVAKDPKHAKGIYEILEKETHGVKESIYAQVHPKIEYEMEEYYKAEEKYDEQYLTEKVKKVVIDECRAELTKWAHVDGKKTWEHVGEYVGKDKVEGEYVYKHLETAYKGLEKVKVPNKTEIEGFVLGEPGTALEEFGIGGGNDLVAIIAVLGLVLFGSIFFFALIGVIGLLDIFLPGLILVPGLA